ncbi:MAG: hypothetical protein JRG88_13895, partial [Deltaproteobacteria bacterium]|nr:hypothetical protein [Deltaproteobacteria bacterium]
DMQRRVPGIEKIKTLVGFEPKTDLDTILNRVIEAMRSAPAVSESELQEPPLSAP